MSETCRGHLWDKIIIKLFASSWYIFLTYIYDARSHLYKKNDIFRPLKIHIVVFLVKTSCGRVHKYFINAWGEHSAHFFRVWDSAKLRLRVIPKFSNPLTRLHRVQGRIKLFGAPRQWKHFRPLFQAVFLSGGGVLPPRLSQTPRLPVPRQK